MTLGGRRLLLVHAHPDDESIETGGTMARYAAAGVAVTLVTCTRGELGEVIPPELAHLEAGPGETGEELGEHRIGELAAACAALGVTDHRFLGGPGRWRDSGMMGLPGNDQPGCFWQADLADAAGALLAIIEEVQPQVIVTYDARGFYGHPDHIQAHRVAREAFNRAGGRVRKFYATALPYSARPTSMALTGGDPDLAAAAGFTLAASLDELPFGVPDAQVSTRIDVSGGLAAKRAALAAHATQIAVAGPLFALSDGVAQRALAAEHYTLLAGPGPGAEPGSPWETDLFAGID